MQLSLSIRRLLCVILLSVFALPAGATQSQAPSAVDLAQEPDALPEREIKAQDAQRYAISIKANNTRMTLRVNDIPVFYKIFRAGETVDISFNEWLKRGLNIIDINVERFNSNDPYDLRCQVYYQSPIQVVNGDKLVLYSSPDEVNLPLRQPVGIRINSFPALRIWQAEEVSLTGEEQQRLLDTINGLRNRLVDAVVKADNAFLATYNKASRGEISRSYGRLPETEAETLKRRGEIAAHMAQLVNAPFAATPVLRIEDVSFERIAGNHLVIASRNDGSPLIQVTRGDLTYTLDKPIFGSIGGIWEMLR